MKIACSAGSTRSIKRRKIYTLKTVIFLLSTNAQDLYIKWFSRTRTSIKCNKSIETHRHTPQVYIMSCCHTYVNSLCVHKGWGDDSFIYFFILIFMQRDARCSSIAEPMLSCCFSFSFVPLFLFACCVPYTHRRLAWATHKIVHMTTSFLHIVIVCISLACSQYCWCTQPHSISSVFLSPHLIVVVFVVFACRLSFWLCLFSFLSLSCKCRFVDVKNLGEKPTKNVFCMYFWVHEN